MSAQYSKSDLQLIEALESIQTSDDGHLSQDDIAAVLEAAGEKAVEAPPASASIDTNAIEIAIQQETDWRKKAALSAFLISKSLDD